jgi:hypothetical protein
MNQNLPLQIKSRNNNKINMSPLWGFDYFLVAFLLGCRPSGALTIVQLRVLLACCPSEAFIIFVIALSIRMPPSGALTIVQFRVLLACCPSEAFIIFVMTVSIRMSPFWGFNYFRLLIACCPKGLL